MPEKRNKYDTDPLDPDFARRAEESLWGASRGPRADETEPLPPASVTEEQTRRFDDLPADSYPSVFVPPAYQPPRPPEAPPFRPQPFTSFGAGPHQPPATTTPPPAGPSSPYQTPFQPYAPPSSRAVTRLGLPENVANVLPYAPFYIGLVASVIELVVVPRGETRTRFHAAQGLALQLAIVAGAVLFQFVRLTTGSRIGGTLFGLAAFIFLVVSILRVWQGKPHHIAPLDEPARYLDEKIAPMK
ncbi:MAG TPA: hypothetical protein VF659_08170 [Pyrinomonadaceae bacterium]|jgi:uncharacterized membrane protein